MKTDMMLALQNWMILLLCSIYVSKGGCCEPGWSSYEGHCYLEFKQTCLWGLNDARVLCRQRGGEVVVLDDVFELNFIKTLSPHFYYTGITDNKKEDEWLTLDGRPAPFLNWAGDEPNNADWGGDDGQENCHRIEPYRHTSQDYPCRRTGCDHSMTSVVCEAPDTDTNTDLRSVTFERMAGHYLWGYDVETLHAATLSTCSVHCLNLWPVCISFNFYKGTSALVEQNCVLNKGTHREFNRYYLPNSYYPSLVSDIDNWVYAYFDWPIYPNENIPVGIQIMGGFFPA